ncbi:MAG: hypothetical protein M3Z21_08465 [Pseudomonadota bacterium]|nr:hypothetical protein [Pseudomonadota bacterium]
MAARAIQSDSLFSIIVGPMVWAAHFLIVYITTAIACAKNLLHLQVHGYAVVPLIIVAATALAAGLIVNGGVLAWRRWRGAGGNLEEMPPHDRPDKDSRRRFMAYAGLLLCGLSLVATLWVAMPYLFIDSCR